MQIKKNTSKLIPLIYIIMICLIYSVLFVKLEYNLLINHNWLPSLSLMLISFCLLSSLTNYIYALATNATTVKKCDALITTVAFAFTLVSDFFLSSFGNDYEVGLITFIIVQITYFIRIELYAHNTLNFIIKKITFRLIIIIILLAVALKINMFEPLYIKTAIYFSLLCTNFLEILHLSIKSLLFDKKDFLYKILLTIGFLLFIGCDICVGINNLIDKASNLIWIFYSPSQLLLCISSFTIINRGDTCEKSN